MKLNLVSISIALCLLLRSSQAAPIQKASGGDNDDAAAAMIHSSSSSLSSSSNGGGATASSSNGQHIPAANYGVFVDGDNTYVTHDHHRRLVVANDIVGPGDIEEPQLAARYISSSKDVLDPSLATRGILGGSAYEPDPNLMAHVDTSMKRRQEVTSAALGFWGENNK